MMDIYDIARKKGVSVEVAKWGLLIWGLDVKKYLKESQKTTPPTGGKD